MKVVYVSKALVTAAYRDKLRELASHADVAAIIPRRWGRQRVEAVETDTVPMHALPALLDGRNHLHLYRGIGPLIDHEAPDLVHIDEEPYSAVAYQVARLCARRRIPCLVFAWQNLDKRIPFPFGLMRDSVLRTVAGAIAGTERAAAVLERAGCREPIAVIPQFGVDPCRFRPDPARRCETRRRIGAAPADFVVGFGGRLVREKGVHVLLAAAASVPGCRLVFVGDGPERARLGRAARAAGMRDRVVFVGAVPSTEMAGWLVGFDVVVLPSLSRSGWREQFGRILIESMACGVPVVGSDSGEIPSVLGEDGEAVPEGDVAALGAAIRGLAANPAERERLGRAGRERVCRLYTQAAIAAATAEFYGRLLDRSA